MHKEVLVLLDLDQRVIKLYGAINRIIPFGLSFLVTSLLKGQKVIYISDAYELDTQDIVNALVNIVDESDYSNDKLYLRSKENGYVRLPEVKLTFSGPKDVKPLEKYGWDVFDRSDKLRLLLVNDQVEVLTESQVKTLKKPKLDDKAKERYLDSLIIDKPVNQIMETNSLFEEEDKFEEINPNEDVETDHQKILKQLGIQ